MWLLPDEFKFVGAFLEITDAIKTCDARILDILIYLGFSYPQENKMINLVLSSWLLLPTGEQDDKSRFIILASFTHRRTR
jgi:hypothetical protein